jgi:UDP-N-acetylmuramoylalanine--D-glutamate ligase
MSGEATMTRWSTRFPALDGARVLVLGLGRSGLAAARLAASRGASLVLADRRTAEALGAAADDARQLNAELHLGGHPASLVRSVDLVVLSPGIPDTVEPVVEARRRGLPVWGEVELAGRFCRGRVIGITGSNGKSTVTSMVGTILRGAGVPGGTGGNLGRPFSDLLAEDSDAAVHAVELSSFQIETLETLRPAVGTVLNLSPDHLDRYASFEAYAAAKARLFELQGPDDAALLNADDEAGRRLLTRIPARRFEFSTRREIERGAFVRDGRLVLRIDEEELLCDASALPVRGEHNVSNALAAALAARLVGCDPSAIADGLLGFRALPHRLERVRAVDGVEFYNDSKATNPDSMLRALTSFPAGRVHLILGGRDKGTDWASLAPALRRQAARLLLVGETTPELRAVFDGVLPLEACETIERAVHAGLAGAHPGDVVLLAPACASFDQYANFEARGDDFRNVVAGLAGRDDARDEREDR